MPWRGSRIPVSLRTENVDPLWGSTLVFAAPPVYKIERAQICMYLYVRVLFR